uniref:Nonstructural protein 1 n=1 Tax=Phoenicurus auroreus ambidensovirus TaxID=2794456 RepID=A0A8A4XDW1_9VIRU|nr:MAG: nonstructural protein 1 [Phoenicurus auroreus ambidensovirus]
MHIQVADENLRIPCCANSFLSFGSDQEPSDEGLVEDEGEEPTVYSGHRRQDDADIRSFTEDRCGVSDTPRTSERNNWNESTQRSGGESSESKLGGNKRNNAYVNFIFEHLCSPPILVEETECFLDSAFTNMKRENKDIAMMIVNRKLKNMTLGEIEKLLLGKHPLYKVSHLHLAAVSCEFNDYYYTVDETIQFLTDLFRYQIGEFTCDESDIAEFVNLVYRWLNRQNGKKNCLQIIGPPTSYKSAFGTLIAEAVVSAGYCNLLNKNERFSLENFIDKRVGIMDDPNFSSDQIERLLTLFSGDKTVVNVKFQCHRVLTHIPILVLCNSNKFECDYRFRERIVTVYWKRYNVICEKKLNPLALHVLFNKYVQSCTCFIFQKPLILPYSL